MKYESDDARHARDDDYFQGKTCKNDTIMSADNFFDCMKDRIVL